MTREEMLKRLHSIKAISTQFVATYDMGLQFDVLTGEGATTDIGNVGSWPYAKMNVTDNLKAIKERIVNGEEVTAEDILRDEKLKKLLTYSSMYFGQSWVVEGNLLENCVANLKKELVKLNPENDYCYFYIDLEEWSRGEVILFNCYEDMCEHFAEYFGSDVTLYDEMNDEELETAYEETEGCNSYEVSVRDITDDSE